MGKLSLDFKKNVLKKLRETHTKTLHKPLGHTSTGWDMDFSHRSGSMSELKNIRPEFKKLLANCGIDPTFCGNAPPAFQLRYSTGEERITVPWPDQFESEEAFYRVLLHELTHWSGTKKRLNREMGELDCCKYHSVLGAAEEITAELSSVMLAEHFGFTPNYERAVDYINGYIGHIADNSPDDETKEELLALAVKQASAAVDYIVSHA